MIKEDRFVFDLDRGEVYYDPEALKKVKFIEDSERCQKIKNNHHNFFNDANSHIFEIKESVVAPHCQKGLNEELPSDFLDPEHTELNAYFSHYSKLIGTSLILPLIDSSNAVS